MLRRQLQEDTASQWSNATLNSYLNLGLQFMQTAVLQHDPEAFFEIDRTDFYDADNGLVPQPVGCIRINKVKVMYDGNDSYLTATWKRNDVIDQYEEDLDEADYVDEPYWTMKGQWIRIWPEANATTITDGIELLFVPTLTMGSDADVPLINLHLHEGIVYRAKSIALGDTDEESDPAVLEALDKKLSVVISRIPLYYTSHGPPGEFELDFDHTLGWD